jgi:hypothetical protein
MEVQQTSHEMRMRHLLKYLFPGVLSLSPSSVLLVDHLASEAQLDLGSRFSCLAMSFANLTTCEQRTEDILRKIKDISSSKLRAPAPKLVAPIPKRASSAIDRPGGRLPRLRNLPLLLSTIPGVHLRQRPMCRLLHLRRNHGALRRLLSTSPGALLLPLLLPHLLLLLPALPPPFPPPGLERKWKRPSVRSKSSGPTVSQAVTHPVLHHRHH